MDHNTLNRFLLNKICNNQENFIKWMQEKNLLAKKWFCMICKKNYFLQKSNEIQDGYRWKCNGRKCNKSTISLRKNSFFANSKLPLTILIFLIYEWAQNTPIKNVVHELKLNKKTIIDWFRFCRDVCFQYHTNIKIKKKIGGPGKVVEIDETVVTRRKYNVGRVVHTVWLVGGITRGENFESFLQIVDNRSGKVLSEVILENVEPGTTIITDLWKGYSSLSSCGFNHFCINHSLHFVDPKNAEINTQKIESTWCTLKRFLKTKGTNLKKHLDEYFVEFLYRKEFVDVFSIFLAHISLIYKFD